MDHHTDSLDDTLGDALRRMPVPPLRPDFADRALAIATAQEQAVATEPPAPILRGLLTSWQTWIGALAGGAATAIVAALMWRTPALPLQPPVRMTLATNEVRSIDVMIASERELPDATIRIHVSGGIELDGFDNERDIDWHAHLDRGSNLLSVPVVARAAGPARLIATVEHGGRTRTVAIDVAVVDAGARS